MRRTSRWAARPAAATLVLLSLGTASALAQSPAPVESWRLSIPNHVGVISGCALAKGRLFLRALRRLGVD
jgi:hypothetical protein